MLTDVDHAISTLHQAYALNESLGNIDQMALNMEYIGQFYYDTDQYGQARDFFERAKVLYGQLGNELKLEVCEEFLAKIEEKLK